MRIVVDYRPALRERTGVGEYVHGLVRAYGRQPHAGKHELVLFTSSWKDRPQPGLGGPVGATVVDFRVPVRVLNYLWHRVGWPPAELLTGEADVVHAMHPLLIPTRRAAQVVTICDLFFLSSPELTSAEIRRDYPLLAPEHARRADAIVVPSEHTAQLVRGTLSVPGERVHVSSPGPPEWKALGHGPNLPPDGYVLFVGTLEPRKNVGALLDAYAGLLGRGAPTAPLVLAGRETLEASEWLARLETFPLAGSVRHLGYIPDAGRESLYAGARLLVMPSLDEGFGLPVLEAMSAGVPVVAARRGSLPEVIGDAGLLVDPNDIHGLTAALARMLDDYPFAAACAERGLARARDFSWDRAARALRRAYLYAVSRRDEKRARAAFRGEEEDGP